MQHPRLILRHCDTAGSSSCMVTILLWGEPGWGQPQAGEGQSSPATPPPLCARLSRANRGNPELLNLPQGLSLAMIGHAMLLACKAGDSPWSSCCKENAALGMEGSCPRRRGINHLAHRGTNTFVFYRILTSKQNSPEVDGLLIPFAEQPEQPQTPVQTPQVCIASEAAAEKVSSSVGARLHDHNHVTLLERPAGRSGDDQSSSSPSILFIHSFLDFRSSLVRLGLTFPCTSLQHISMG